MEYFIIIFLFFFVILRISQGFIDMKKNQNDIELLRADPGKLILKYQETISLIVYKILISAGFYPYKNKKDLIQEVNVRLLEKMDKIQKEYDQNKAQFITFISLKIVNICYQMLREDKKHLDTVSIIDDYFHATSHHETDKEIYFIDEYKKYEAVLKLFYRKSLST